MKSVVEHGGIRITIEDTTDKHAGLELGITLDYIHQAICGYGYNPEGTLIYGNSVEDDGAYRDSEGYYDDEKFDPDILEEEFCRSCFTWEKGAHGCHDRVQRRLTDADIRDPKVLTVVRSIVNEALDKVFGE